MYTNFILTRSEPIVNGSEIQLGVFNSGCIVVDAYPTVVYLGGVIHLVFEADDEPDIYEVELRGTDLATSESHVLWVCPVDLPPPDDDWKHPRSCTLVVPMRDSYVIRDLEMALDVEVNRQRVARQNILVRDLGLP